MSSTVSVIIPAWNEEAGITSTLYHLHRRYLDGKPPFWRELIVVDDGSRDATGRLAYPWADKVIRCGRNRGKGYALASGWQAAQGDIVVFLDADLGESAVYADMLVAPVAQGLADMTIAVLPEPKRKGGYGLARKLATYGIRRLSGFQAAAPLSGQRAIRKRILEQIGRCPGGFGIEVGLTIDAARLGCRIAEVPIPFTHRETGRDLKGFVHRGKQFVSIGATLMRKWRKPLC